MIRAVIVQTTRVSIKVCVILTNACLAGTFVFAAAAAIGAEPRPDSFEKTPRATPKRIAAATVAPTTPPAASLNPNACEKIR